MKPYVIGNDLRKKVTALIPFSWRDAAITAGVIAVASVLCAVLQPLSDSDFHVPLIFVLAVLLVSLWTNGYLFGIVSSIIGVFGVNAVLAGGDGKRCKWTSSRCCPSPEMKKPSVS